MKNHTSRIAVAIGAFLLPTFAFAASINNISNLYTEILAILNGIIPIVIALAVIYVIYGIVMSFTTNDEEKRGTAHIHVLYGVIGLFVIVSLWGLVNILVGSFGLSSSLQNGAGIPNVTGLPNNQLNSGNGSTNY